MAEEYSFNLVNGPWLPVVWLDGRNEELSLRQVLLEAHLIRELSGDSPLVTVALYRLLLAILHRVFGPESYRAWADLWRVGQWDAGALNAYLDAWAHRFDLFDKERPFYQALDPRVEPKSVISMTHELASGNHPVHFDHHTEAEGVEWSSAQAARFLVTAQSFGFSGSCNPKLKLYFTDGTCTRGVHFLIEGNNLFETLVLNLLQYPDEDILPVFDGDMPAWENNDPLQPKRDYPLGYLDYLTWQNRRILLIAEDGRDEQVVVKQMTWTPALGMASDMLDPFKQYRGDLTEGYKLYRFSEDRALWRDSAALLSIHADLTTSRLVRPPRNFMWLKELLDFDESPLEPGSLFRYRALGMSTEPGKAVVLFYRDERLPLPLSYLDRSELVGNLQEATDKAEEASRQLWGACRTLATFLVKPGADGEDAKPPAREDLDSLTDQWAPERGYWVALELPFRELVLALPDEGRGALTQWHQTVREAARHSLEETIRLAGDDGRALKAAVRARQQLAAGLAKVYRFEEARSQCDD